MYFCIPLTRTHSIFFIGAKAPSGVTPSSLSRLQGYTQTGQMTPLDKRPAGRTDLYLTTHNSHKTHRHLPNRPHSKPIPASERPQTHAKEILIFYILLPEQSRFNVITSRWITGPILIYVIRYLSIFKKKQLFALKYTLKTFTS